MSAHASDEELRGKGSKVQHPEERTSEGLGGCNIQGFKDPKTKTDMPNTAEAKTSDPEWVHRRDPETLPKYMQQSTGVPAGKDVGYDPGSATVAMMEGAKQSSGASASQTGLLPRSHEIGGRGDPQALGNAGGDTYAGSGQGVLGAGPKQRDRASVGDDTLVVREDFGKRSSEAREKAGTPGGIQGDV